MIKVDTCEDCIHSQVCCKKETLEEFKKKIHKVVVGIGDQEIMLAEDSHDVAINLKCMHRIAMTVTRTD